MTGAHDGHGRPDGTAPRTPSPHTSRRDAWKRTASRYATLPLRAFLGVTFVYAGAHGPANGLDFVLDAAIELGRDVPEATFVLVGDGISKPALVERARRQRLDTITFLDPIPKNEIPDLLAAAGIRYVCDWGNDEQPYKMTPQTGELYALGVHAYLDDNYIHLHGRRTINEVNRLWREWFDGLYTDGATTGRVMVLHLHPWIMGQPWRIRHSTKCSATSPPTPGCGKQPAVRSSTGSRRSRGSQVGVLVRTQTHPSQGSGEAP